MKRRVAVTGLGVVSPVGNDRQTAWTSLTEGRGGVGPLTRFDPAPFDSRIAAEVRGFDPERFIDRKTLRHVDLFVQYAWVAAIEAFGHSGLDKEKLDHDRFAVLIGSGIGGINTLVQQHQVLLSRGP
jgi:3-oxoacyl-[acyl-carrier-protein] synthase II